MRSVVALLRPHRRSVAVSMILLGGATVLILMQPMLAGRLVDRATAGSSVLASAVALVLMLATQFLLDALGHFRLDRTGERIVEQLRADFTDHVVRLPIGVLDRGRAGELLSRGTSDAALVRDLPRSFADVVFGAVTLIGAVALMVAIDPVTVGIVVAVMAVALGAAAPFLSRVQRASLERQAALGEYAAGLDRALGAARTVKLFGAEGREATSIGVSAHRAYRSGVRIASATAINTSLVRLGVTAAFMAIVVIDGSRVADGTLPVGKFVTLFAFAMYAVFPLTVGIAALNTMRTAIGAYQNLTTVLDDLPEGDPPASVPAAGAAPPAPATAPLVEFDHVSFSYGATPVLHDVSFTLERDQVTALIGASGAGKSTIIALLCRFHEPTAGILRWEGVDVARIPLAELRGRLSLLEQDAPVLHGTVRDNLLIADPGAADAELWRCLEQANLSDEIASLPGQLDAPVLERGRALSGGQRQRLALARAFLSRSELILMDEPTAHLDRANEDDVMGNVLAARSGRSLLVVAHRLASITVADQILVLQQGRIQAAGTHTELMRTPAYRDLVEQERAPRC